ncbi:carboxy-terminal processing protease CtpB precursor [bacterium BMS3Bbin06]|nr:carboxy-terminal processing protease CtpB precursor [bacterium BMS3Abin08]GBE35849.1 carboxy-terminal processing protease CtpB precursor [bacterium BMS3Bbin06]HDO36166.1 S41 family peptidase [Nitrospirota bacterium]HDY72282.1 S41 family peptidase [Nitrospirota bacterium]
MKRLRIFLAGWVVILVTVTGLFLFNQFMTGPARADSEAYEELKLFTEVLTIVNKNYVEKVNVKDLVYGAIRGMLKTLDPHSSFMSPDAYKEMQIDTTGEFGGLGIQIGIKDGILTVIAPIEDTPAWRAGIKAGDKIIKVEGEPTKDMSLIEAVHKMRGPRGTKVTITVFREGWKETKDFDIVRDIIKIKSVKYKVVDDSIGYVKISQFQQRTASELEKALKSLKGDKVDSLILDLRNNPGGLLKSAVDVSGEFLPPGKLVVYIQGRTGKKLDYLTKGKRPSYDWPMVVLVNQGSASASEIVAGAMKDWKRAVLIGVKTFGKGSVQSVIPLSDGSGLRLTTAKYYTPSGVSIQNTGIEPDIKVKLVVKNGKGHPVLREKDLSRHLENEQAPENGKETTKETTKDKKKEIVPLTIDEKDDTQLQRSIDLLKSWRIFKNMPLMKPEAAARGKSG